MHRSHWRLASTLVLCSIAAGLCTTQVRNADAAGDCLAAPKDSTPQGKHWYYRVDRPTKRACWYLGEEGRKTSRTSIASRTSTAQASTAPSSSSEKPSTPPSREPLQPTVANARAELTNDIAVPFTTMPPIGQQNSAPAPRDNPAPQINEPTPQPNNSRFAERWPDQNSIRVAQADTASPSAPAPPQPAPIQQASPQQAAAPASPAPDDSSDMLRIILAVLTATIALAAIIGRLILSHRRPRKRPAPRRPIWQTTVNENADPVHARASHSALRARAEADVEDLLRALRYPPPQRAMSPNASASRERRT